MGCLMDMGGLGLHIGRRIGRMDVSLSLIRRLRRFGRRWGMELRLRFGGDVGGGEDAGRKRPSPHEHGRPPAFVRVT